MKFFLFVILFLSCFFCGMFGLNCAIEKEPVKGIFWMIVAIILIHITQWWTIVCKL